jgi:hypothetical protein
MVKIFNRPKPLNHPPCSQPMPLTKDEKTAWKRCTAPNGERRPVRRVPRFEPEPTSAKELAAIKRLKEEGHV